MMTNLSLEDGQASYTQEDLQTSSAHFCETSSYC